MTAEPSMSSEAPFENERKGATAGLNPMFGDWQHRFRFAPVPYGDGGAKRAAFRKAIQAELTNKFFYTGEVRLEITLHLDIQTVLETSETADLDNYAKTILDGLKGPAGLLLDDSQVQTLIISYIDNYGREGPSFDVAINAGPDDFMLKPVAFYEMPDRLWHPHGRNMWTDGEIDWQEDRFHYAGLLILEIIASAKANTRHLLRKTGLDRLGAFQRAMPISSSLRGFHRSRIDADFEMFDRKRWQDDFERWRRDHVDEIVEIEKTLAGVRENYERMGDALAGRIPARGE
jgi:Holliday junction resolvase RusA-like endonuclease